MTSTIKNNKGKRVTIKDIARKAKVSPATVSIILSDKETSRVRVETRQRILKIASALNYKPNLAARSLVGKQSFNMGLVITTLMNPFYAEIAQDIIYRARDKGYGLIASSVGSGDLETERNAVQNLIDRGVDGLIICSALRKDPVVDELRDMGIPFVLVNRLVEQDPGDQPMDSIVLDNHRGAFLEMEHLIKMGHKRIAFISGPQKTSTGYDRQIGAIAALEASGLKAGPVLILYGDFTREAGYKLTMKLLQLKGDPTAIFAANDHMAMGVLSALGEERIKVPEDIAVVGFDDINMASLPGIELTTVSQKKTIMGRLAVDHLVEKITGESTHLVKRILLDPILVIRRTCGFHKWERQGQYAQDKNSPSL